LECPENRAETVLARDGLFFACFPFLLGIRMNKNNLRKARNENKFLPIAAHLAVVARRSATELRDSSYLADNIRDSVTGDLVLVWFFGPTNDEAVRR
jgi:hypothetical protein